jgi:hypothetical protein
VPTYAYDPAQSQLVAVWPLGTGYHAAVITHVNHRGDADGLAELCEELTRLSHELWDTATPSPPAQQDGSCCADGKWARALGRLSYRVPSRGRE